MTLVQILGKQPERQGGVPSAQTPPDLRHHYHQVVEFSHWYRQSNLLTTGQ
jgi:hypothetical protein